MADVKDMTKKARKTAKDLSPAKSDSPLSGPKGIAAGVAVAAAPFVIERIASLAGSKASDLGEQAKEKAKSAAEDLPTEKLMPKALSGGVGGALGKLVGGSDNGDGDEAGAGKGSAAPGTGSGRRMPIQQSVDVAAPLKTVYNQWTQFEDWPDFMHRFESVDQVDDATVAFQSKIWGIKKRFEAEILEQRPDERIEWDVSQGLAHSGVVTFHQLSDRLTRIEVTLDIEPDSLVEKAGRGWRFAKRAVRGDLHRFKAFVELNEEAEDGWRGTIEDGEVKRKTERKQASRSSNGSRASSNGRSRGSSAKKEQQEQGKTRLARAPSGVSSHNSQAVGLLEVSRCGRR